MDSCTTTDTHRRDDEPPDEVDRPVRRWLATRHVDVVDAAAVGRHLADAAANTVFRDTVYRHAGDDEPATAARRCRRGQPGIRATDGAYLFLLAAV
ncbi:hypothetical protein [Halobaculum sp. MBLA0143]|uniref:hypothetical protein n=1 Tax=Halobaculum sp. MBLA0143 TaxID=3079933 RepID=UPI003523159A